MNGTPWSAVGLDAEFARLADQVPGFGGLFIDVDRLAVYLVDLRAADRAAPAFESYLRRLRLRGIRWLQGQYDWRQLLVWRSCVDTSLWAVDGIVMSDISDSRNRIVFGFHHDKSIARAEALLAKTAVPRDAVILERMERMCTLALRASVIVEIRDDSGQPAAIGATVTIRKDGKEWTGERWDDPLRVTIFAENEGGIFEVRITKPGYVETVIPQVQVPEGPCGVTETIVVRATISR